MSRYVENSLGKDEVVVVKAKKNPLFLVPSIIFMVILLVAACVLSSMYGFSVKRDHIAVSLCVEKELTEEFDELSAEEQEEFLKGAEVSSRSELKSKLVEEITKGFDEMRESAKESGEKALAEELISKAVDSMLEAAGIENSKVTVAMIMVIVSYAAWGLFGLVTLFSFLARVLKFASTDLALTNKRVLGKMGFIKVVSVDVTIEKVDHAQIKTSLFGNIFKYNAIRFLSVSGAGFDSKNEKADLFVGISNANDLKDALNRAIETAAEQARKVQAEEIARAMGK